MGKPSIIPEDQNFFHLASIQSVSLGLPAAIVGKQLAHQFGPGIAIFSIFVGNLILWLVGLAIVSMIYQQHTNAIENIKGYIGRQGGFVFALILILAFLDWYVLQIDASIAGLSTLFQYSFPWDSSSIIRIGAVLGILSALLAIGGIRLLKWITVSSLPFIICYNLYAIFISDYSLRQNWNWGLSLPGILITILVLLPGVINLPTFFRHSRSRADSFLALTLMTFLITFFESATIWMSFSSDNTYVLTSGSPPNFLLFVIPTALYLIVTGVCSNLLNIYLASACYETFIPKFQGTKGHMIMGLLGTAVYTFLQITKPVEFLVNLFNCYIGVLGVVLIIGVLARIIIRHRPRKFEKSINAISWLIGCITGTILIIQNPNQGIRSLLFSMSASMLFFLLVFFVEETIWSFQKVKLKRFKQEKLE